MVQLNSGPADDGDLNRLRELVATLLRESISRTGHGGFAIRATRVNRDSIQLIVEGTTSHKRLIPVMLLEKAESTLAVTVPVTNDITTMEEVERTVISMLLIIWKEAKGNGGIEIKCRRQQVGKSRIHLRQYFDCEIVLRNSAVA